MSVGDHEEYPRSDDPRVTHRPDRPPVTIWQLIGRGLDVLVSLFALFIAVPIAFGLAPPLSRQALSVLVLVMFAFWAISPRPTWRDLREEWRRRRDARR